MNKKLFYCLIILAIAVCGASILSSVSAADLENHDFDGEFSMSVPIGIDFTKTNGNDSVSYLDEIEPLMVIYYKNSNITEDTAEDFYTGFTSTGDFVANGEDGKLKMFKSTNESSNMPYCIGTHSNGKIVIIGGEDLNSLKEMAKTIKFN